MATFAPKPGCPLCGIVSFAQQSPTTPLASPSSSNATKPQILWKDDNFTVYQEKSYPVSSKGHIIIVFNLHVPSIYTLSSSDLPLLIQVQRLGQRLLGSLIPRTPTMPTSPLSSSTSSTPDMPLATKNQAFNIGFITSPFKDPKIPITDHLHAHAYIGTPDLAGWWRAISYSSVAWYAVDDLIAEIRESTSNNRIKSGYENRTQAPIDTVPDAGSRTGFPNGVEDTHSSIKVPDLEEGEATSPSQGGSRASLSTPQSALRA
ncbi:hypothetical protein SISNIDRAFT_550078 [Sistotremastrum niveocremeum HHB9708]|uniref:HIT domain-containing protein n=1 Tax=Sistotremastrum niveocremeum HHB9708 TaxID=1314777 RepID=A0A164UAV6_9AGAM|nr:hypothetical protein SISNIDRAFT_550078 [Sistotremastrum niveocremeum HHB9708]